MLRRAREVGPALLVPLAWLVVVGSVVGVVDDHALFVAHVVMAAFLAAFVVTGRADMREGTLRVWWLVVAVGFVVTVVGALGFRFEPAGAFHAPALFGWMLLPAAGFLDTGRRADEGAWLYLGGAAACVLGAGLFAVGVVAAPAPARVAGLSAVGVGQTAGILDAVLRY
jgi:hypothetical protein